MRTKSGRYFKDVMAFLGSAIGDLTPQKMLLVKYGAFLDSKIQEEIKNHLKGKEDSKPRNDYVLATINSTRRILESLGLEKNPKEKGDIFEYVQKKYRKKDKS